MKNEVMREAVNMYPNGVMKPFDEVIDKVGYDALLALVDEFGGGPVYVPTKKRMFRDSLELALVNEFDGGNIGYLSGKYDYSARAVKEILSKRGVKH